MGWLAATPVIGGWLAGHPPSPRGGLWAPEVVEAATPKYRIFYFYKNKNKNKNKNLVF
jgi:hypothetical protein